MDKKENVTFSTTLSAQAKESLSKYCKTRGLKINYFLEEIIWDRLEEEMDIELYNKTDLDDVVSMEEAFGK